MKADLALKIAAATAKVSQGKANTLIAGYIEHLAICSTCEGTRTITYRQRVRVPIEYANQDQYAKEGEIGPCPTCGPEGRGDPDWVAWVCRASRRSPCQPDEASRGKAHSSCGWALAIPLPEQTKA